MTRCSCSTPCLNQRSSSKGKERKIVLQDYTTSGQHCMATNTTNNTGFNSKQKAESTGMMPHLLQPCACACSRAKKSWTSATTPYLSPRPCQMLRFFGGAHLSPRIAVRCTAVAHWVENIGWLCPVFAADFWKKNKAPVRDNRSREKQSMDGQLKMIWMTGWQDEIPHTKWDAGSTSPKPWAPINLLLPLQKGEDAEADRAK